MERNATTNGLEDLIAGRTCTKSRYATIFAWEGDGVWVLKLTDESAALWDSLDQSDDWDDHLRNVKLCGGVWFENPMDSVDAAAVVRAG